MKKIVLTIMLFLPLLVFANNDSKYINVYDGYVSNPNGINVYDNNSQKEMNLAYEHNIKLIIPSSESKTLKNNTLVTIIDADDNKMYYDVKYGDVKINFDSFSLKGFSSEGSSLVYNEKATSFKYFSSDKLNVYVGPGDKYSYEEKSVSYGSTLKFNYYIYQDESDYVNYLWIYVEFENAKGWVKVVDSNSFFIKTNEVFLTANDIDVISGGNVITTIPANTIISPNYESVNISKEYYIAYNNQSGIISGYDLAYGHSNYKVEIKEKHLLYDKVSKDQKVLLNLPRNAILATSYYLYQSDDNGIIDCIYTSFSGVKGWVCFENGEKPKYVYNSRKVIDSSSKDVDDEVEEESLTKKELLFAGIVFVCLTTVCFALSRFIVVGKQKKKHKKLVKKYSKMEDDK